MKSRWLQPGSIAFLVIVLYYPVLKKLVSIWWDNPDYSHGFLVPLITLFLVWQRHRELKDIEASPSRWGLFIILVSLLMLAVGQVGAERFLTSFSLLPLIAGLVLYLMGRQFLARLAFPLILLIFMIPPPAILFNQITVPLQLFAAGTATSALQLIGVPVLREGNVITLATQVLEVTEACSGIGSIVSLTLLALLFSYFTHSSLWKRAVLTVSAVPIAIVANAFRVAGTGFLSHFFTPEAAMGFYHTFSGWLVFVVAFALLLVEGFLLSQFFAEKKESLVTEAKAQEGYAA